MTDASRTARSGGERTSLYAEITTRIIAELEAGRLPWVQPWGSADTASLGLPRNASSGRAYSGINVLILWGAVFAGGFSGQTWLTYRQAQTLGGNVRKGERGTTVVYADRFIPDRERHRAREEGDDAQPIPFLKRFTVFNTEQCDGLPENIASVPPPVPEGLILPRAEALIRASGVDVRIGGARAFYHLQHDYVQVPPPQSFFEPVNWHRTALHELGHSTGHPARLGRDLSGSFGSRKYAVEELVAEIASAFLCAALGIVPTVRHADYIGAWLDVLRNDDHAIVRAASQASKAADYLLGLLPDDTPVAGAAREAA
ncbi:ArdC family protein [Azospirillum himalayense]|uniref:ArdC family protein n=1 Tax=Azospirillum himalayense TaxID=654847 RepID=A0ABW0G683_9PROT